MGLNEKSEMKFDNLNKIIKKVTSEINKVYVNEENGFYEIIKNKNEKVCKKIINEGYLKIEQRPFIDDTNKIVDIRYSLKTASKKFKLNNLKVKSIFTEYTGEVNDAVKDLSSIKNIKLYFRTYHMDYIDIINKFIFDYDKIVRALLCLDINNIYVLANSLEIEYYEDTCIKELVEDICYCIFSKGAEHEPNIQQYLDEIITFIRNRKNYYYDKVSNMKLSQSEKCSLKLVK